MTNVYWPLTVPDSLGGVVGADDVRDAVRATIETWAPFYVAVISDRLATAGLIGGPGQNPAPLPDFGEWKNEPTFRNIGSGQPAAFLVRVPATVGTPDTQGNGQVIATWRCQVTVQVFGTQWEEAADLASWYEKAVRLSVMQHKSLGGFANSTKWMGNQYSGKEHSSSRTEGLIVMAFDVKVGNVIDVSRGPATVPVPPVVPAPDNTVATTSVTIANDGPEDP